jgi:hypothetical protein
MERKFLHSGRDVFPKRPTIFRAAPPGLISTDALEMRPYLVDRALRRAMFYSAAAPLTSYFLL